jgi:hypothetical protein
MKSACLATLALLVVAPALAEDTRQLATLHPLAQETLRQEMRDNLIALNQIVTLLAANQVKEAGELAEKALGRGAMGQHARKPFEARPGPQMPTAMHDIGRNSHSVASDFARAAATGERDKALAELPALIGACVACHSSYRIR